MDFVSKLPIEKGWSGDEKYCASTAGGTKYLLRLSPPEKSRDRERLFPLLHKLAKTGIPMSRPVALEKTEEGVCTVFTWVEGRDAEEFIPRLPEGEQYAYGLEAGHILKVIHSLPAPADRQDWEGFFNRKIDRKMAMYRACPIKFEGAERIVDYINANRPLLAGRPVCFQHGDYHIGNMMVDERGRLVIIDFDRYDFGDPWEEFNRIVWCAQAAPRFASGMVDGYFGGNVPEAFWRLLALYIGSNTLSSVPWAIPFGDGEVRTMLTQAADVLDWYGGMTQTVPGWYAGKP